MLHTALGYPHWGEGAWGPLQFLTSRQHSLIGEQPSAQPVGHRSPMWVAPGGSFFCFGRPLCLTGLATHHHQSSRSQGWGCASQ